ncbi:MAG: hypothetical protein Q9175_005542 [Cornicularia normoerica]
MKPSANLCEGVSGKPQITLRNGGIDQITNGYPFHAEVERNNDRDGREDELLDLGRGLSNGDLMITDKDGRQISLKCAKERRGGSYYELMSILPGLIEPTFGFRRIRPKPSRIARPPPDSRKIVSPRLVGITRESDRGEYSLNAKHRTKQALLSADDFQAENGLLEFNSGTTYTYHFYLGKKDLYQDGPPCVHNDPYILKTKPQGFAAWDYGTEEQLLQSHQTPSDRCKHGPIVFEPVCDVALTIKPIMEREKPMPLFRMPPELRDGVYEYPRYAHYADKIPFTAQQPW